MKILDRWWTAPAEAENGKLIMVTGHDGVDEAIADGRYRFRIDITWRYNALPNGLPEEEDAKLMEQVTDALLDAFRKDKTGIVTGIYTGDGERDYVIYTRNLKVFGDILNRSLKELPTIPIQIEAEEDPDWSEYLHMRSETYIPPEEN